MPWSFKYACMLCATLKFITPYSSDFLDPCLYYHNISLPSIVNHEILDFYFFVWYSHNEEGDNMEKGKTISLRERIRINLVTAMENAGINQVQLADKLNISKGTVNNWTRGNNSPDVDMVPRICEVLGISVLALYSPTEFENSEATAKKTVRFPQKQDEADDIANRYRELDDHGKGAVKAILNFEEASFVAASRQSGKPAKPRSDGFVEIKVFDQPAAAGLGNYLDDPSFHIEQYPANEVPEGTEFGIRISGNSMAPNIPDGATVFVQSRSSIEPGKIGIFLLNEESYCKKLAVDRIKREVRLVSFNRDYKDRIIEDTDVFSTMALVLGWWPKG